MCVYIQWTNVYISISINIRYIIYIHMHNHTSLYLSYSFGAFVIVRKHVHKLEDEHPGDFSIVSPPTLASSRISKPRALSGEHSAQPSPPSQNLQYFLCSISWIPSQIWIWHIIMNKGDSRTELSSILAAPSTRRILNMLPFINSLSAYSFFFKPWVFWFSITLTQDDTSTIWLARQIS